MLDGCLGKREVFGQFPIIRAKRVSNCYIQEKKKLTVCVCGCLCGCSANLGFSVRIFQRDAYLEVD